METVVNIFMWLDLIVGATGILALLVVFSLNAIAYCYESYVGFETFRKFLRKYGKDMEEERTRKVKKEDLKNI